MTTAADLVLTNATVHTLGDPDETHEAVAVRDGRVVRVGSAYEVDFLVGVDTDVLDLEGRVLLPGFVDAHTHLLQVGRHRVDVDLQGADGPDAVVERLRDGADGDGWLPGYRFDDSDWDETLTRAALDAVSAERPVVAVREDMHVAVLNTAALDRVADDAPAGDVDRETGRVVEDGMDPVWAALAPDRADARDLLRAAGRVAVERGVTTAHDMVRRTPVAGAHHDLAADEGFPLRVRLNYWRHHLDALDDLGLRTETGAPAVGAVKTFTDGSIGARTARLDAPYADAGDERGQWVVAPDALRAVVTRADRAGFQMAAHAIGDAAIGAVLDAYAATDDPGGARHRVEHAELATDEQIRRMADLGVVASVQPNFHKWAGEGGLYADRLGDERRRRTNRLRTLHDAGVPLAFGSDCMPFGPLVGVHHAVNAPTEAQRLTVTEALRAYTRGGAYAGHEADRIGTVERGKRADLVALERSPWEHPEDVRDCGVALTVAGGDVVHDAADLS